MDDILLDIVLANMVRCGVLKETIINGVSHYEVTEDSDEIIATKCAACTDPICNAPVAPTH